ncbi:Cloroperoxidase [Polyplosphaeria fusca]|uniref:Cloroperoxidase n=1 Tax=Polyplosphaeria fusca TaxID=682080 RepID=A0A9P4V9G1_9PLEO|nr:Cloroperoxidase [Polyplosphaeria fusca]
MIPLNITCVALFSLAVATADCDDNFSKWHPPVPGDLRSPCPLLNALANHGIIPHNGSGLTIEMMQDVLPTAINMSVEAATTLAEAGLSTSDDPASGVFTLEDLNKHNKVEHDASLSRKDFDEGGKLYPGPISRDDHTFNQDIFDEFLEHLNGTDPITIPAAAAARFSRIETERARNPNFTYGPAQQFGSYLESAVYLRLLTDPNTGTTPVSFVKIFFEQERLPFWEGWRTPSQQISGMSIAQDILQLALATGEKVSAAAEGAAHGKFI